MEKYESVEVVKEQEPGSQVKLKVMFTHVGEVHGGTPYLRCRVYKSPKLETTHGGFYTTVDEYESVTGLSYLTNLTVTTDKEELKKLAQKIADKVVEVAENMLTPMMIGRIYHVYCDPTWEKWLKELNILHKYN